MLAAGSIAVVSGVGVRAASAQTATAPTVDEATVRGRAAALRGIQLSKEEQWGDALAAFEEAAAARDAPLLEFYIAYCEREEKRDAKKNGANGHTNGVNGTANGAGGHA